MKTKYAVLPSLFFIIQLVGVLLSGQNTITLNKSL